MAVIWTHENADGRYEVRTAGKSVRLYTNGVFHSQWNPNRLLTRSVWDSLMLSAFFLDSLEDKRVLVLGVGGGVVIKQIKQLFPSATVVGVELNPVHIRVARRWFQVTPNTAEIIEADAKAWLENYQGEKFDLIIDDLFGDAAGEIARAVPVDHRWSKTLVKHLSPGGVLAVNFIGSKELQRAGLVKSKRFYKRYHFTPPFCENAIGIFVGNDSNMLKWRRRLNDHPGLKPSEKRAIINDRRKSF